MTLTRWTHYFCINKNAKLYQVASEIQIAKSVTPTNFEWLCNVYRLELFFAGKSIHKHTMCVCYFMYKEWMPYSADCSISIFKLCTRSLHVYIQNTNALKLYNLCNNIMIIWDRIRVYTIYWSATISCWTQYWKMCWRDNWNGYKKDL